MANSSAELTVASFKFIIKDHTEDLMIFCYVDGGVIVIVEAGFVVFLGQGLQKCIQIVLVHENRKP
jgi:hypothetical protein